MSDKWVVVGAIASLVAAATGLTAVYDGWTRRRAERASRKADQDSLWSLKAHMAWRGGHYALALRYENITHLPIHLVSVCVIEPSSTISVEAKLIQQYSGMPTIEPTDTNWQETIAINRDLYGIYTVNHEGSQMQADFALVHLLAKPSTVRTGTRGRFRLRITYEERTATRREQTIFVTSEPIVWGPLPVDENA